MKGLLLFVFVACYLLSDAQIYQGQVLDVNTNEPLPGANLFLVDDWRTGTVTDAEGYFELQLDGISTSDQVIISFVGYHESVITLDKLQDVMFLKQNDYELEVIVVEEQSLVAAEFKYEKLDKLDIYLNPAAKADPLLAVATLPSATNGDESANISLRGSNSEATGIFFNDVPIYDAVRFAQINGIGTFGIFNTAIIKDLAVFPGNPPLEYGNVSSGLISMTSSSDLVSDNSTAIGVGLANFGFMRSQKVSDKVSLRFFGNYQPSSLLKFFNQQSLAQLKKFNSADLGVLLNVNLTSKSTIRYFNYSLLENYKYLFSSPSYKGDFSQQRRRNFSVFNYGLPIFSGHLSFNSGISFSLMDYHFSNSKMKLNKEDLFFGINFSKSITNWDFKIGYSSDGRSTRGQGHVPVYDFALGEHHPHIEVNFKQEEKANELFLYAKQYIGENIIVGYGLRKAIDFRQDYLSAQANMALILTPKIKIIAGLGRYHRLALEENADNKMMLRSDQVSTDLKYDHENIQSGISLFHKTEGVESKRSIKGVEYYFQTKFSRRLSGDLSFTWLDVDQPSDFSDERLNEINYFVKSNIKWLFGQQINASLFSTFRQGGEHRQLNHTNYNESLEVYEPSFANAFERLPDYFSVGVSVSKVFALSDDLGIIGYMSVNNALNRKNIRGFEYNDTYELRQAEFFSLRTIYFGAQFSF